MDAIRRLYEADPLPRPSPTLQLLFSAGDILAALLIIRILRIQRASETAVLAAAAAWLCNPFTLTISTRGSCDVVAALLLLTLLLLLLRDERRRSVLVAAAAYGLVVHLRIYPIIYAPALVLFLTARALAPSSSSVAPEGGRQKAGNPPSLWRHLALRPAACIRQLLLQGGIFGGVSAAVFFALGVACYALHGQRFLDEAFLHHLTRRDPRHNFSPHFYPIYLGVYGHGGVAAGQPVQEAGIMPPTASLLGGLVAELMAGLHLDSTGRAEEMPASASLEGQQMLPDVAFWASAIQILVQLVLAAALHRDLPRCMLLQTMAFVALNKVREAGGDHGGLDLLNSRQTEQPSIDRLFRLNCPPRPQRIFPIALLPLQVCTAQYFVWYFSLIPLVLPKLPWPLPPGLKAALGCWVGCQLHWLLWGYLLEFQV